MNAGETVWARSANLEILCTKQAAEGGKMSSLSAELRSVEWELPGDET